MPQLPRSIYTQVIIFECTLIKVTIHRKILTYTALYITMIQGIHRRTKRQVKNPHAGPSAIRSGACFLFCFQSSLILSHAGKHEIMRWFCLVWTWNVLGVGLEIRRIASGTKWSELLCAVLIFSAPFWIFSCARAYSTVNAKSENVDFCLAS